MLSGAGMLSKTKEPPAAIAWGRPCLWKRPMLGPKATDPPSQAPYPQKWDQRLT